MSAQAVPMAETAARRDAIAQPRTRVRAARKPCKGTRVHRLPGPEALLHPSAAEALVLAFRPLSWGR